MEWTALTSWGGFTAVSNVMKQLSATGIFTYTGVIIGHNALSYIYSAWCNSSIWDSLWKPTTPACRGILWGMNATSDSMLAMWLVVGTSIAAKLSGIL
jgi:hypothetical protein